MIGMLDPATEIALVIGLMSGLTILLVGAAFAGGGSRRFNRRLQEVTTRQLQTARSSGVQQRTLARRDSATPGIDRFFRMLPRREMLVERLAKTGRTISVGQYMMVTIGVIAGVTVALLIFTSFGLVPNLLIGIAVGTFIPHYLIGRMGKKRVFRFVNLFPEAIDLMVRALRAGLPISEAIINAGQEISDPVGPEFQGIEAETLNNLSNVLRGRRAMRAKARAMASEARASTMILGSLPVLVTIILMFSSPAYIMPLFTDVRGLVLVGVAVGMLLTGVAIMVKMARFEI
jgi:tight adherence protein B